MTTTSNPLHVDINSEALLSNVSSYLETRQKSFYGSNTYYANRYYMLEMIDTESLVQFAIIENMLQETPQKMYLSIYKVFDEDDDGEIDFVLDSRTEFVMTRALSSSYGMFIGSKTVDENTHAIYYYYGYDANVKEIRKITVVTGGDDAGDYVDELIDTAPAYSEIRFLDRKAYFLNATLSGTNISVTLGVFSIDDDSYSESVVWSNTNSIPKVIGNVSLGFRNGVISWLFSYLEKDGAYPTWSWKGYVVNNGDETEVLSTVGGPYDSYGTASRLQQFNYRDYSCRFDFDTSGYFHTYCIMDSDDSLVYTTTNLSYSTTTYPQPLFVSDQTFPAIILSSADYKYYVVNKSTGAIIEEYDPFPSSVMQLFPVMNDDGTILGTLGSGDDPTYCAFAAEYDTSEITSSIFDAYIYLTSSQASGSGGYVVANHGRFILKMSSANSGYSSTYPYYRIIYVYYFDPEKKPRRIMFSESN